MNKIDLKFDFLVAYLIDDTLFIYSKNTHNIYGLEKEKAAKFLDMNDKEVSDNSFYGNLAIGKEEINSTFYEKFIEYPKYYLDQKKERDVYYLLETQFHIYTNCNKIKKILQYYFSTLCIKNYSIYHHLYIDIFYKNNMYYVYVNHKLILTHIKYEYLYPLIQSRLLILAYQKSNFFISLHAASIEYNKNINIFCGSSGSGKSTLSYDLYINNYNVLSDELTIFDQKFLLYYYNLPFNIKENTLKLYDIKSFKTFKRFDDINLEYIPHISYQIDMTKNSFNKIFYFIKYNMNTNKLKLLSFLERFLQLKNSGYQLNQPLNEEYFKKLIQFITKYEFYTLEYTHINYVKEILKKN